MRQAVRAVVVRDGNILVIHRNKFGKEYDTLPGGGVELGETHNQALVRELHEEASITIAQPRLIAVENGGPMYGMQYVYLCEYVSGEPQLHPASEEALISRLGKNLYLPQWVPMQELSGRPFVSERLKQVVIQGYNHQFMGEPVRIG